MLEPWNWPLFGPICKLQPTNSILNTTMKKEPILLLSDAMVQKKKQSGFAWVISHHAQPLWKGIGLALGHVSEIYSRRAEAFGLLAGLTFLQYYISCYGHKTFIASPIQCFCHNMGVTTNVTALIQPQLLQPNATMKNDDDVYLTISKIVKQCAPMQPQFLHV